MNKSEIKFKEKLKSMSITNLKNIKKLTDRRFEKNNECFKDLFSASDLSLNKGSSTDEFRAYEIVQNRLTMIKKMVNEEYYNRFSLEVRQKHASSVLEKLLGEKQ
tara:strand:- start:23367 stop:23681 length:315 start_codon:yes stop_codon:yes gene_type:complete